MAQYSFSFVRSEYDRIPYVLKRDLNKILENAEVDDNTKAALAQICEAVEKAVTDLSKYACDQLVLR